MRRQLHLWALVACLGMVMSPPTAALAEQEDSHGHGHEGGDEDESHTHDHRFELGLSPSLVFLPSEKELAAGLHAHAVVNLLPIHLGLGLGYERIFDEHAHNTVGAVIQYHLMDEWMVFLSPGVSFPDDSPGDLKFAMHLETAYEFALTEWLHLGPSFAFAFDPDEVHLSIGLHLGIGI